LTLFENLLLRYKISEYHTGYRAYSRAVLDALPLEANSDDFVFDNQMLAQITYFGYRLGEVSCPMRYFAEAFSINFWRSITYGFRVLATSLQFRLQKWVLANLLIFSTEGHKLLPDYYVMVKE
jgi:hypothetical protein